MNTIPRRALTAALAAGVTMITLAGCASAYPGTAGADATPTAGGTIVYATDVQPQAGGLDPYLATSFASFNFINQIYEPLLSKDAEGTVQPLLATEWEQIDDTTWTVTLREGVTFSDGTPLTSADVVFSFQAMKAGVGAMALSGIADVVALDEAVVQFTTAGPDATFLNLISSRQYPIVSQAWYEATSEGDRQRTALGTGPFVMDEWQDNVSLTLVRNENYWDDELPYADSLRFDIVGDETARASQLRQRSGTDMAWFRDPTQVATLEAEGFTVGQNSATRALNILINGTEGPLADVRVRQAVSQAMDREELITLAMGGYAEESLVVPAGDPWGLEPDADTPNYTNDVEGAKELLAEAGQESPTISLTYASDAAFALDVPMVEVLKEQLAEAGITLELKPLPWSEVLPAYMAGTWSDLILVPGVYQADPALYFTTILTPGLPMVKTVTADSPEVALFTQLRSTTDEDARKDILAELEDLVAENVNVLVAYTMPQRYEVWGDTVSGYDVDPYTTRDALKDTFKAN
jgi:peptide/nickel transport system substrate-binding protein